MLVILGAFGQLPPNPAQAAADAHQALGDDLFALLGSRVASIFQKSGLIPVVSVAENVEVALRIRRVDPDERDRRGPD